MKPSVIVCGCGRSGTNVVLELLRGNPIFEASEPEEDKLVFSKRRNIAPGYLTKCDTVYFKTADLVAKVRENECLKIVWTIRHPFDMAMSKLRRGVPESEGGDCKRYASDGNPDGAIDDINNAVEMLAAARGLLGPENVSWVRMEDVLRDPELAAEVLCEFLGIRYHPAMPMFWTRMRNQHKQRRYHGNDRGQIDLWRTWQRYEGGWLLQKGYDMPAIFKRLGRIAEYFGYEMRRGDYEADTCRRRDEAHD